MHEVELCVGVRGVSAPGPGQDDYEAEDNRDGDEEMESVDHDVPAFLVQRVHERITPPLRDLVVEVW